MVLRFFIIFVEKYSKKGDSLFYRFPDHTQQNKEIIPIKQ